MRLDLFLANNKYFESRNKACSVIESGGVCVNGRLVTKPSFSVSESDNIEITTNEKLYVARSAIKLITATEKFGLSYEGKTAVDLGASTGGFCEVMLEKGIKKIYAVDIGTNQLHPKIKADPRVVNKQHTNARYISASDFDEEIDLITCDLSFISLTLVLNAVMCALKQNGEFICLIKPQFEVGNSNLNKNGVVKNKSLHVSAIRKVIENALEIGFEVCGLCFSGLEGESGNKEYLLYLKKSGISKTFDFKIISEIVLGD